MSAYGNVYVTLELESISLITTLIVHSTDKLDRVLVHLNQLYNIPIDELEIRQRGEVIDPSSLISDYGCDITVYNRWESFNLYELKVYLHYLNKNGKPVVNIVRLNDVRSTNSVDRIVNRVKSYYQLTSNDWTVKHQGMIINGTRIDDHITGDSIIYLIQREVIGVMIEYEGRSCIPMALSGNTEVKEIISRLKCCIHCQYMIDLSCDGVRIDHEITIKETNITDGSKIIATNRVINERD